MTHLLAGQIAEGGQRHIAVCICTYRRPHRLAQLLETLQELDADYRFTYSVVVVDNDRNESARSSAHSVARVGNGPVRYCVEPEQNIALARNRAVRESSGDLVAMIDDDELPETGWLSRMYDTLVSYAAQGVLGPVRPRFEVEPEEWVIRGEFCERPFYPTGTTLLAPRQTRTGNALLLRTTLEDGGPPFDSRFGLTGGEDVDFFARRLKMGDRFVWCQEAPVYEWVPAERATRRYMLQRALLRGVANADNSSLLSAATAKSLLAAVTYTAMLPFLVLWRHDRFMHYLIRDCDHLGKVFALCGIRLMRSRATG